ncbi:hypothetical protein TNCV_3397181 [Trichonephila clavipes]|nr:hypothetical protein TNCV_3397181 [Trichonephila clavipes]
MKHLLLWNLMQQPTPATVESDPTASTTPTQPSSPSSCSGRKVHLPTRYRLTLEGGVCSDLTAQHNDSKTEILN